jgi:uncharacterized protein
MSATVQQQTQIRVTRLINAPRERVFAAWVSSADLLKWFGPEDCHPLSVRVHPRADGEYHFRLQTDTYGEIELQGVFREIKRPGKLVFTWNFSGHRELNFGESVVTVELLDRNGATEVQITHERLPNEEVKQDHIHGWNGCMDKLERYLGGGSQDAQHPARSGEFCWNELLVTDEASAKKFYSLVLGWETEAFPGGDIKYTLWKSRGKNVGGLMKRPAEDIAPHWLGYVTVADVDATARKAGEAGGKVLMEPFDVPTVGRIAVFEDPQGAALGIIQPLDQHMTCSANQIVWCDIPVKDLDRAIGFYSAVLGAPIKKEDCDGMSFAVLPRGEEHGVSGCLTPAREGVEPSRHGALIYFNCQGRLDQAVAAAQSNGGKVLEQKHQIGPYGYRAIVLDSEGNRIALHSM